MRITILNGDPQAVSGFCNYIDRLAKRLAALGHSVEEIDLRHLDLKGCSGCFGCWVKTPGECVKRDDSARICRSAINSDLWVLASPLTMGFTTALLKRAADQAIPLLHPYFVMEGGEIHHRARYARYPAIALLLGAGADADSEDIEITTAIWASFARDFKSRLVCAAVVDRPVEEVANEFTAGA
jgi:multimeric flavodoxin WrbA